MRQRTFTCRDCGTSVTVPVKPGRPPVLCEACRDVIYQRNLGKAKTDRDAARVAHATCQRPGCELPIPPGSRADRKWCSRACQSWNNRRERGEVQENTGNCTSCLEPLAGRQANATLCGRPMCMAWAQRHPGVPHPSTQPRVCKQCSESIDHLNAKAKFCSKNCTSAWLREQDREGHNAKARAWQSSEKGKAARRAYLQANADKRQAWARQDRQKNRERYLRYYQRWAEANPELAAEIKRMRRARQFSNPDSVGVSTRDLRRLLNRSGGFCTYCGEKAAEIHIDHVVPLAKGGRHGIGNLAVACSQCNHRKHAMFLSVWRYRGRRWLLSA